MKILCFGDSNTYGYIPSNGGRYDKNTRWTGILTHLLNNKHSIIEAGCNNRTAFKNNPAGKNYTGHEILPTLLTADLDIIILSIGINDLQTQYNTQLNEYHTEINQLIKSIKEKCPNAQIILLAPPRINEGILKGFFATMFDKHAIEKSTQLPKIYEQIAKEQQCEFINLDEIINTSKKDGLHLEPAAHKTIAETIYKILNI